MVVVVDLVDAADEAGRGWGTRGPEGENLSAFDHVEVGSQKDDVPAAVATPAVPPIAVASMDPPAGLAHVRDWLTPSEKPSLSVWRV